MLRENIKLALLAAIAVALWILTLSQIFYYSHAHGLEYVRMNRITGSCQVMYQIGGGWKTVHEAPAAAAPSSQYVATSEIRRWVLAAVLAIGFIVGFFLLTWLFSKQRWP